MSEPKNPVSELAMTVQDVAASFKPMSDAMKGSQQAAWDDFNVELGRVQSLVCDLGVKNLPSDVLVELKYATEKLHGIAVRLELDLLGREQKRRDKEAKEDADRAVALRKELP